MNNFLKKTLLLLLIICLPFNAYSYGRASCKNPGGLTDSDIVMQIYSGFYGVSSPLYDAFFNDLSMLNVTSHYGFYAVVHKRQEHDKLIIGHSIVAMGYETLKDKGIDIVGLYGARTDLPIFCHDQLNKNYNKVYVWLGVNDLIQGDEKKKTIEEKYDDLTSAFDKIYELYSKTSEVYFMSINQTNDFVNNDVIFRVNHYLKTTYNYIEISEPTDLGEYHFSSKTFKKIVDKIEF